MTQHQETDVVVKFAILKFAEVTQIRLQDVVEGLRANLADVIDYVGSKTQLFLSKIRFTATIKLKFCVLCIFCEKIKALLSFA